MTRPAGFLSCSLLCLFLGPPLLAAGSPPELEPEVAARAAELRDRTRGDADPWSFVADLTTEIGARPAGSAADLRAVEWAVERLRGMGLERVWTEPVEIEHWERGEESGRILAPWPHDVVLTALGGSVGTPDGGLEAEVVGVADLEELAALPPERIAGRLVYVGSRMERSPWGETYAPAVRKRRNGASLAAARGAVGLLIRSVSTSTDRFAHTGSVKYTEDAPRIPAAALSNPDADLLERVLASDRPVRFRLRLGARWLGAATSANVLAEVRGREHPDEIVLMAAHLDSWDLGTGAMDDGSGCAIVSSALAAIAKLEEPPRRTVRILLAANEERGLDGARAYARAHGVGAAGPGARERHVAAFESDFGIGRLVAFRSRVADADLPFVASLHALLEPFALPYQGNAAFGGADLRPLEEQRVPLFDLPADATRYFDLHHTANDTLDKLDPGDLREAAAAYATLGYALAETAHALGPAPIDDADEGDPLADPPATADDAAEPTDPGPSDGPATAGGPGADSR